MAPVLKAVSTTDSVIAAASAELSLVLASAHTGCCDNQDAISPSDCFSLNFLENFLRILDGNPTEGLDNAS